MKRILLALLLLPVLASAAEVVKFVEGIDHPEIHSFIWIELCKEKTQDELLLLNQHANNAYDRKSTILSVQDAKASPGCSFLTSVAGAHFIIKGTPEEIVACVDNPKCFYLESHPPPHLKKKNSKK